MSAVFSLVVLSAPQSRQGSLSAYHFANALLQCGHRLLRVFFYGDGAYHGNASEHIPSDELDLNQCWQQLAATHGVELALCSGSRLRD